MHPKKQIKKQNQIRKEKKSEPAKKKKTLSVGNKKRKNSSKL